jgi:hypothetical protein
VLAIDVADNLHPEILLDTPGIEAYILAHNSRRIIANRELLPIPRDTASSILYQDTGLDSCHASPSLGASAITWGPMCTAQQSSQAAFLLSSAPEFRS